MYLYTRKAFLDICVLTCLKELVQDKAFLYCFITKETKTTLSHYTLLATIGVSHLPFFCLLCPPVSAKKVDGCIVCH